MSDTFDTTESTEPTEANTAPDAEPSTAPDAAEPAPSAPTQDDSLEPLAGDPPSMDNADTESEADLEKKDATSASAEDVIASPTETSAMDASTSEASSSDEGESAQDAGGAEGTVPFDQGLDVSLAPDATFGADSADAEKTPDDLTLGENLGGNDVAPGDASDSDSDSDGDTSESEPEDAEGDQPIEPARPKFVDIVTGELITSGPGFSFDEDLGDKSLGEASHKAAPTGDKDKAIATFNEAVKSLQAAAAALTSLV